MSAADVSAAPQPAALVNVGCGRIFHPAWINLDYAPASLEVRACDLRRGLPLANASADAVYHSHVLEHLTLEVGEAFLRECHRLLRPGGILRIAVPDLEGLARAYIAALDAPAGPDPVLLEWLRLELVDQFGRERPGGRIPEFVRELDEAGLVKVRARIGMELDVLLDSFQAPRRPLLARLRAAGMRGMLRRLRVGLLRAGLRMCGGREMAAAFDVGLYRGGGEVHRTLYDRHALRVLLERIGFAEIWVQAADESRILGFASYGLESCGGRVRKPDSLFMEAVRP